MELRMNVKRIISATFAVFGLVFLLEFFIHGHFLANHYENTSNLWRDQESYKFGYMLLSQFSFALFVVLFRNCAGSGGKSLFKNSALFGLILASLQVATYSYMPIPCALTMWWCAASFLKGTLAWLLASAISK